ncbi:MAG: hypothetical protein MUO31_02210, partial [Thermodesulfovibrionales bacterium]|nr:hypothetical protein [Thermodesulfovibrionales bacterium]
MGNEPQVVIAERNSKGLFIPDCPHCRQLHALTEIQLGTVQACPISGKLLKISPHVGVKEEAAKGTQKTENPPAKPSPEPASAKQKIEEDPLLQIVMDQHEQKVVAPASALEKFQPEKIKAYLDDYIIGQ